MAGRGKTPNPNVRRRKNDGRPTTALARSQATRPVGPMLPKDREWCAQTLAWYDTWRRSPQAATFCATDFQFLIDTALLKDIMWTLEPEKLSTRSGLASEVRLREGKLGATVEDRLHLRMTSDAPLAATARQVPATPSAGASDRRERLLRAVESD